MVDRLGSSHQSAGALQTSPSKPARSVNPITPTFDQISKQSDHSRILGSLNDLKAELKAMPADQAAAWIRTFLNSGKDKSTHLSFVIGNDRTLSEWPTFRTFLIDTLLSVDPAAAVSLSREILNSPTSADEWAIALRNVGKVETSGEATEYLRSKTEALIANPNWQADPSIGYLNAFDVLVHTDATGSTPLLSNLIQRKDRKDLAHAAFLTLDRLVQRQPADVLTRLAADPGLSSSYPEMVAQQFARADLRNSTQREIVKNWLLDSSRTVTELNSFAGTFPNENRFISNNLLTKNATPSLNEISASDTAALSVIDTWLADPSFESVKSHLTAIRQRLTTFVSQSSSTVQQPH